MLEAGREVGPLVRVAPVLWGPLCFWGELTIWAVRASIPSLCSQPHHTLPTAPTYSLRFKQLLLTQADKFSPAEVRIPGSFNHPSWTPSQGSIPQGPGSGGLSDPLPSWA